MFKLLVCTILLGVGVWSNLQTSYAAQIAPLEIQIREGDTMVIYDCWPSTDSDGWMIAYLNYAEGTAMYTCYLADKVKIQPVPSPNDNNPRA